MHQSRTLASQSLYVDVQCSGTKRIDAGAPPAGSGKLALTACRQMSLNDLPGNHGVRVRRRLGHRDEPLIGQHRLDNFAAASAARHDHLVLLLAGQQSRCLEVRARACARRSDRGPRYFAGALSFIVASQREDGQRREVVPLRDIPVVEVVRRRDLDARRCRTSLSTYAVGDDRDPSPGQRQHHLLADEMRIPRVVRIAPRPRRRRASSPGASSRRSAARSRRRADSGSPRACRSLPRSRPRGRTPRCRASGPSSPGACRDRSGHPRTSRTNGLDHGAFDRPSSIVKRSRDQSHEAPSRRIWLRDGRARLLPSTPRRAATNSSRPRSCRDLPSALQLVLDDDLRRDAGVIGADLPQRVVAAHAVIADQHVHQRLLERVSHVQRAGDVRRRQLNAERRRIAAASKA